ERQADVEKTAAFSVTGEVDEAITLTGSLGHGGLRYHGHQNDGQDERHHLWIGVKQRGCKDGPTISPVPPPLVGNGLRAVPVLRRSCWQGTAKGTGTPRR